MRKRRPRILIISASAGTGHVRAGAALAAASAAAGAVTEHVDILDLAPRWVAAAYGGGFELLVSRAPALWRGIYQLADGPHPDRARWGPMADSLLFRRFRRLLLDGAWDSCICTHFLPAQLARGHSAAPSIALVLTDFAAHRFWIQPHVRQYFVASDRLADTIRKRVPGAKVAASGIPVDAAFGTASRAQARAAIGFSGHEKIALVIAGGWGVGVEEAARAATQDAGDDVRTIVVCGRNRAAYETLARDYAANSAVHVIGYTRDMPLLMAAADVVVTKPGGLTCSEALAAGRALVLTKPIPGHEEANASELALMGAALAPRDSKEMKTILNGLWQNPQRLAAMSAAALAAGRPAAAAEITRFAMQRLAVA